MKPVDKNKFMTDKLCQNCKHANSDWKGESCQQCNHMDGYFGGSKDMWEPEEE